MITALLLGCLVFGVPDGDSLKVRCPNTDAFSIRVAEIDAPEIEHKALGIGEQPYGRESKAALTALCLNQPAEVQPKTIDKYRRTVAKISCNGVDVGTRQVVTGNAWAYYTVRHSNMPALQAAAQEQGVGLWALPHPIKPSLWRKGAR